jgi:hypothetical protein
MIVTTQVLLAETVHGTPSGNYDGSSQLFYGDPVTAANYYGGISSVQTAYFRTTGFVGDVTLQATLADFTTIKADQAAWFEVGSYTAEDPRTDYHPITVTGNFTFMRVRVELFESGTINLINLTY